MRITPKTSELIKALENLAHKLDNKTVYYNWHESVSCNCGLLIREIFDVSWSGMRNIVFTRESEMYLAKNEFDNYDSFQWGLLAERINSDYPNKVCPDTGIPIVDIVIALKEYGLDLENIKRLEYPIDPATEMLNHKATSDIHEVADYMRYLAEQLRSRVAAS